MPAPVPAPRPARSRAACRASCPGLRRRRRYRTRWHRSLAGQASPGRRPSCGPGGDFTWGGAMLDLDVAGGNEMVDKGRGIERRGPAQGEVQRAGMGQAQAFVEPGACGPGLQARPRRRKEPRDPAARGARSGLCRTGARRGAPRRMDLEAARWLRGNPGIFAMLRDEDLIRLRQACSVVGRGAVAARTTTWPARVGLACGAGYRFDGVPERREINL